MRVAEPGDQHPHRDQDQLEGDEEEHGVARVERGQRSELDQQEAGMEGGRGATLRRPVQGVQHHAHTEDRGEQQQWRADPVDGQLPADPVVLVVRAQRRELELKHMSEIYESEARFSEIVGSAMDAIVAFEAGGRFIPAAQSVVDTARSLL